MPASTLDLKELQVEKMLFLNFTIALKTDTSANMYGNLRNSDLLPAPVVEDALKPALGKSIKTNYSWN